MKRRLLLLCALCLAGAPTQAQSEADVILNTPSVDRACTATNFLVSNGDVYADLTCRKRFGYDFYPQLKEGDGTWEWHYAS